MAVTQPRAHTHALHLAVGRQRIRSAGILQTRSPTHRFGAQTPCTHRAAESLRFQQYQEVSQRRLALSIQRMC